MALRFHQDAIDFVMESMNLFGIHAAKNSRFSAMKRLFRNGTVEPDHPQFEVALESIKDFRTFEFFFDNFNESDATPELKKLLRHSISDNVLPHQHKGQTKGRDAQAELFVAAICKKAGLCPEMAEPDVLTTFEGEQCGIAVKRPKQESQYEAHVRKGSSQIHKAGIPGIIAIDASISFNPDNRWLENRSEEELLLAHNRSREAFMQRYYKNFERWTNNRGVLSILAIEHEVHYRSGLGWILESFVDHFALRNAGNSHFRIQEYWKTFAQGIPGKNALERVPSYNFVI